MVSRESDRPAEEKMDPTRGLIPKKDRGLLALSFFFWASSCGLLWLVRPEMLMLYPRLALLTDVLFYVWSCGFSFLLGVYGERTRARRRSE